MDAGDPLERAYRRHVGEPPHPSAARGYWTVVAAVALAALATAVLVAGEVVAAPNFLTRQVAVVLLGLAGAGLGVGVSHLLPVGRVGSWTVLAGAAACALALALFWLTYPAQFNVPGADYAPYVLAAYGLGLAVQWTTVAAAPLVGSGAEEPADGGVDAGSGRPQR